MKRWKSKAVWGEGFNNITSEDSHYTKEQAEAVCHILERDGFGGEGKYFPIKTCVEEINLKL